MSLENTTVSLIEGNPVDSNILLFEVLNATLYQVGKLSDEESYFKLSQNGTPLLPRESLTFGKVHILYFYQYADGLMKP